jgi:hypothetical protein
LDDEAKPVSVSGNLPFGGASWICRSSSLSAPSSYYLDCYEHRVFTTEQLRRLHFVAARTARERLQELRQLRLLTSF